MIDVSVASALIDGWTRKLNIADVDPRSKFHRILHSVETLTRYAIAEGQYDTLDHVSVLCDSLFIVIENGIFTDNVDDAGTMLNELRASTFRMSCEMFGFSPEDFDINDPSSDYSLLFLRPLDSSNRYQLLNRFALAERRVLTYPKEIPLLSLEASLHRVFQPTYQTISVGGVFDAFGMSRIFLPGRSREDSWKGVVEDLSAHCDVIFVVPSDTNGVAWELGLLKQTGRLVKTVACMVPIERDPTVRTFLAHHDEFEELPVRWAQAKSACDNHGIFLPSYDMAGCFLFFDEDGTVADRLPFESLWTTRLVDSVNQLAERRSPARPDEWTSSSE